MVEWQIPFLLTSPYGTLALGAGTGYLFDDSRCSAGAAIRQTSDDIPQGSGRILHREYVSGYEMRIGLSFMDAPDQPSCAASLREKWEALQLHLGGLLCEFTFEENDVGNRRLQWTPADYGQDRIMIATRLLEELKTTTQDGAITGASFALHSPLSYVVDETENTESISAGGSATITNPGNVPIYPNVRVNGAASSFTYTNETLGLAMVYDDTLPGAITIAGGDFGFFGHFANNAYLNGDEDNLKAGIGISDSDFFPLLPGANLISADGADIDVIWNAGWR